MIAPHVAVEAPPFDPIDPVFWGPESLLVRKEKRAVRVEADAIGSAKARRQDFGACAVLADTQECAVVWHQCRQAVARRLGVIEVAVGVRLQSHRKFVEMFGDLVIAVEILVKVGLSVAVVVMEADDLVTARNVDPARNDLQAQRLEQP